MAASKAKITPELALHLYYIPCPDIETARTLAQSLLEQKLIGCANIIPKMESLYWWDGKIESSQEIILLLKTTENVSSDSIEKTLEGLHPYQIPCLLKFENLKLNASYEKWLEDSMK